MGRSWYINLLVILDCRSHFGKEKREEGERERSRRSHLPLVHATTRAAREGETFFRKIEKRRQTDIPIYVWDYQKRTQSGTQKKKKARRKSNENVIPSLPDYEISSTYLFFSW